MNILKLEKKKLTYEQELKTMGFSQLMKESRDLIDLGEESLILDENFIKVEAVKNELFSRIRSI